MDLYFVACMRPVARTNFLFGLPEEATVHPGHDYKGWTASSIGAEKRSSPRMAGKSKADNVAIMLNLNLLNPKMMDIAVAANAAELAETAQNCFA